MAVFKREREPEEQVPVQEHAAQGEGGPSRSASGVPGVRDREQVSPEVAAMLLRGTEQRVPLVGALRPGRGAAPEEKRIGEKEVSKAIDILTKYKQGKAMLETRVVEDELWWELRHWEVMRKDRAKSGKDTDVRPEPTSAWLFNSILNKHADAMDNYPEPVVLPRERSDDESAKTLSSILPVVLEYNDFEQTYSDNWWEKLKHGTAAYGVFWDAEKDNGLGDISIQEIDLLKLFWEPGVTDIQKSRNLFIVELVDEDLLEQAYPEHKGHLGGSVIDVKQYIYDDTVDITGKSVVVDWYYKVKNAAGQTILHYAKFVGTTLLYASENDPQYQERGWYDHGLYPVVLDVLFPEKGTPVGFGYVAICKDPQLYVDKLSSNILENAMMTTRKRFFASDSTGINEDEFKDWSKPIVHVQGELDERRLQEIATQPLNSVYLEVMNQKIEEMKDTAANRDVNSGSAGSGVTAAAAIAALQEAGNKASRDMIAASYRTHVKINSMCIELMRQFYDETRSFRVTGTVPGSYRFQDFNNAGHPGPAHPPGVSRPGEDLPASRVRRKDQGPEEEPFLPHGAERAGKGAVRPGLLQPGAGPGSPRGTGDDGVRGDRQGAGAGAAGPDAPQYLPADVPADGPDGAPPPGAHWQEHGYRSSCVRRRRALPCPWRQLFRRRKPPCKRRHAGTNAHDRLRDAAGSPVYPEHERQKQRGGAAVRRPQA